MPTATQTRILSTAKGRTVETPYSDVEALQLLPSVPAAFAQDLAYKQRQYGRLSPDQMVWVHILVCEAHQPKPEAAAVLPMAGTGGIALEKAEQCIQPIEHKFDRESIYRAFFRYADDLLFDTSRFDIGSGWAVCPSCGVMVGSNNEGRPSVGRACADFFPEKCPGILRPLTWDDLQPKKEETP